MFIYAVDMASFLMRAHYACDEADREHHLSLIKSQPIMIAQYALAHWNQYCATGSDYNRTIFLKQAEWLLEHEIRIDDAGGWPIPSPHLNNDSDGSCLSATAQGCGISVLVRAYQLTHENVWLEAALRAVRTFELDILEGGVSTPVYNDGVFFEEVANYPAAHHFNGFIFGIFGLYDYTAIAKDNKFNDLIQRSLLTLHRILNEFDTSFWTRANLLQRGLASLDQQAQQTILLEALALHTNCEICFKYVKYWKAYQQSTVSRLRYLARRSRAFITNTLLRQLRSTFFSQMRSSSLRRVCVPVTAFPVTGGVRAVLAGIAQATLDMWQMEYLTPYVGPDADEYILHRFGTTKTGTWQFPMVWLYSLAGFRKLISLLYHGAHYHVIFPQDGVFTAAFAALAAKIAGVRVVCIDHGNLTLLNNPSYFAERKEALATKNWSRLRTLLARLQFVGYWPSLSLLAKISARFVDHFLIPGVVGDGTEEICEQLGIPLYRLTRFGSMIDTSCYYPLEAATRVQQREKHAIAPDAITIAMTCRLAPEKGIDIALQAISRLVSEIGPTVRDRVRVIIAGDGPLRGHVENIIRLYELEQICSLWGETSPSDIISLLGISDIFLYTSIRGACLSMAVLEAMASGCAVIASTRPLSNAFLLAEGRGMAIPAEDVDQTSKALARLVNDPALCLRLGHAAREYTEMYHSPAIFRKTLIRATYWSALHEVLNRKQHEINVGKD